jgi:hypothetical protein
VRLKRPFVPQEKVFAIDPDSPPSVARERSEVVLDLRNRSNPRSLPTILLSVRARWTPLWLPH